MAIAARRLPPPESLVLVTVKVLSTMRGSSGLTSGRLALGARHPRRRSRREGLGLRPTNPDRLKDVHGGVPGDTPARAGHGCGFK